MYMAFPIHILQDILAKKFLFIPLLINSVHQLIFGNITVVGEQPYKKRDKVGSDSG